jgi:hypothetical protein
LSRGTPWVWATRWYLTAGFSTMPLPSWSTMPRWISCHGVWLGGDGVAALGLQLGAALRQFLVGDQDVGLALVEVDAHRSPVLSSARPPPAAASGEALRIDGEPEVPDWRPSPMQGSERMPFLSRRSGGCMFTTSAAPG